MWRNNLEELKNILDSDASVRDTADVQDNESGWYGFHAKIKFIHTWQTIYEAGL